MDILSYWLGIVGFIRFTLVFLFTNYKNAQKILYSRQPNQVTPLTCRILILWGLINAIVTSSASYYMDENKPIFVLAFLSFVIGLTHFVSELVYHKTNFFRNNIMQLCLAGPSIIFMFFRMLSWY